LIIFKRGLCSVVSSDSCQTVRVMDSAAADCPSLSIIRGKGSARVVIWPGNGARYRTFQVLELQDGDRTTDLTHPTDAAYYVVEGTGVVADAVSGESWPLAEGGMVHIDRGDSYRFEASGAGMRLIGGPCPADEALYTALAENRES
jgi:mannose-6-phosphate isomerase-like protein (cupin superfamily)